MGQGELLVGAMPEWEQKLTRPDGYPMMATGIAVLVVLALAVSQAQSERSLSFTTGLLVASGAAIILWAIAYLVTLRHSTAVWRVGSFAIIWIVALLASVWSVRSANAALAYDLTMLAEVETGADGILVLPEHPDRGVLSRATIRFAKAANIENRNRARLLNGLGIDAIGNAGALSRNPDLVNDCDRFVRARPTFASHNARIAAIITQFRADVMASAVQPTFKRGFIQDFDQRFAAAASDQAAGSAIVAKRLGLASEICTILARRHWKVQERTIVFNGRVLKLAGDKVLRFTDNADLKAYEAMRARWTELNEQARRVMQYQSAS
ncbi:hypothetical protein U1769_02945 [Sphingomonas sp. ZT3P38]|uniref:hypothetical protein n=1 Tax=Parasphingomonas zepuensis TaxID=3096161 RepID=UPI002FCA20EE